MQGFLNNNYYLISLGVIIVAMVPFVVSFEGRKPQAREIVLIAVLIALAVVSRAAFFMIPQFKPIAALVIISGVALGPQSGFMIGALSAFVSNFLFGQGPWTPWQMFALGIIGALAGALFAKTQRDGSFMSSSQPAPAVAAPSEPSPWLTAASSESSPRLTAAPPEASPRLTAAPPEASPRLMKRRSVDRRRLTQLCVFGGISVLVLYGLLADTASAMIFTATLNLPTLLTVYAAGLPFNAVFAGSTVLFLLLLARPMLEKLERVKKKYGLLRQHPG